VEKLTNGALRDSPATADLDGAQFAGGHQVVDLAAPHLESLRHGLRSVKPLLAALVFK
jgi:hypothetical protein